MALSHLYKKFVNERVLSLIDDRSRMRNCTVIAHIDHGKTTLTDSLIAASGLLSKEVAATARLLDYDLIEQQRGITIKASGISLIHEDEGKDYLIHLIDTPGHIDFSSHVTRGLRLTDGALVVVDVIEGIMVQTETVSFQAMRELVRPVLFVNKVDRLINERKLRAKQVAEEIIKTVREFNAMLGKYLDDEILEQWEVSFNRGSLCVGSALDKWGIGLDTLLEKTAGVDIPQELANGFLEILEEIVVSYNEEDEGSLSEKYPVGDVILDAMVKTVPPPSDAQKYRTPTFWDLDEKSTAGKGILACDPKAPLVAIIGDVQPDRHAGSVAAARILSGKLERGKPLLNLRTNLTDKSLQIGLFMSKTRVPLTAVPAGNLAFITGVKGLLTGDTLVSPDCKDIEPMSGLQFPIEPVVTYTVEPKRLSDLSNIQEAIEDYIKSDPALEFSVNVETGEMLLSGAGELHIEITVEKLGRQGLNIRTGEPVVLIKEQLTRDGALSSTGDITTTEFTVRTLVTPEDYIEGFGTVLYHDERSMSYLIDSSKSLNPKSEAVNYMREAFREVLMRGPLYGEKVRKLTVLLDSVTVRLESPETSWHDVTQPLIEAIRESFLAGDPVLYEPWIHLEISTPEEHVGALSSLLARRKGEVLEINSERSLYRIEAAIPVGQSFGLANEIRTTTSGWATWGARTGDYRPVRKS